MPNTTPSYPMMCQPPFLPPSNVLRHHFALPPQFLCSSVLLFLFHSREHIELWRQVGRRRWVPSPPPTNLGCIDHVFYCLRSPAQLWKILAHAEMEQQQPLPFLDWLASPNCSACLTPTSKTSAYTSSLAFPARKGLLLQISHLVFGRQPVFCYILYDFE